jgi:hypothetical protein
MKQGSWLVLAAVACGPTRDYEPIVVDISTNCNAAIIEPALEDVLAAAERDTVLSAVHDGAGTDSGWLMIRRADADGFGRTVVQRIDDGAIATEAILDVAPDETLALRASPRFQEIWVVRSAPQSTRLWRIEDPGYLGDDLRVTASGELAGFPTIARICGVDSDSGSEPEPMLGPCDVGDWSRELGFLAGVPHLISVPPSSLTSTTHLFAGRLENQLNVIRETELKFLPKCDPSDSPEDCEEDSNYPQFAVLGNQADPRPEHHHMFLLRERALPSDLELVVVRLGLDGQRDPKGILRSQGGLRFPPIAGPPSGLAIDEFDTYMLHATAASSPRLVRLGSAVGTKFEGVEGLLLPEDIALLQLDADLALGRIDEERRFEVIKLFPDAPEESTKTWYETETRWVGFEQAGPGAVLLHGEDGSAALVQISCVEAAPPD